MSAVHRVSECQLCRVLGELMLCAARHSRYEELVIYRVVQLVLCEKRHGCCQASAAASSIYYWVVVSGEPGFYKLEPGGS